MKIQLSITLVISLLFQQCGNIKTPNHFSSSDDTLIIRTEKHKGDGLFTLGVMPISFKDTAEQFSNPVVFPKQVTNIERLQIRSDLKSSESHCVDIMNGVINGKNIFIVDENNNKDLSDDSVRVYKAINWNSDDDLVKCKFIISDGHKFVNDSSWIRIGIYYNEIWCGRSEHLTADFIINKEEFKIGIIDSRLFGFFYGIYPEAALISSNTETKDTLYEKDIIKIGEYLNLQGNYYRFDNITNNGNYITLIKDMDFVKKTGTQVGMIAPDFICKTVVGDTIKSSSLHDRILIIANSCGCGGDTISTQAYFDIRKEFSADFHVIRLDSKIERGSDGLQIDISDNFNNDIYKKFRNEYCSRTCYVIDKYNKIIDKFPTSEWRHNLPKIK